MAKDSFETQPAGEDLSVLAADPWIELLDRARGKSAAQGAPADEPAVRQVEPARVGKAQVRRPYSLRVRLAAAVVLSVAGAALAGLLLGVPGGGHSARRAHALPVAEDAQAGGADEEANRPWHRDGRRAKPRRARPANAAPGTGGRRHLASQQAEPPVPAEPEVSSAPSVVRAPAIPPPDEPSLPNPRQPRGKRGLADGSRDSSEFGL